MEQSQGAESSSESEVYETSDRDVGWRICSEDFFRVATDPLESCAGMSRDIFAGESSLLLTVALTR